MTSTKEHKNYGPDVVTHFFLLFKLTVIKSLLTYCFVVLFKLITSQSYLLLLTYIPALELVLYKKNFRATVVLISMSLKHILFNVSLRGHKIFHKTIFGEYRGGGCFTVMIYCFFIINTFMDTVFWKQVLYHHAKFTSFWQKVWIVFIQVIK